MMRRLVLVFFVFASINAHADTWVMENQGGGKVVLTDRVCKKSKSLYEAYTFTDKAYINGCWSIIDGRVHVAWDGQGRRVYEINAFVLDTTSPKNKGDKP